jgi:hypothetical protein
MARDVLILTSTFFGPKFDTGQTQMNEKQMEGVFLKQHFFLMKHSSEIER